jgi:hypothetical protein
MRNAGIDAPQVIETAPQLIASIRHCVPCGEMRKVMGPGLAELRAALAAQGIATTGPWFDHRFRRATNTFDFEVCLPFAARVVPVGRVKNVSFRVWDIRSPCSARLPIRRLHCG